MAVELNSLLFATQLLPIASTQIQRSTLYYQMHATGMRLHHEDNQLLLLSVWKKQQRLLH